MPKVFYAWNFSSSLTIYPFSHNINIIVTNVDNPCAIVNKFTKKILWYLGDANKKAISSPSQTMMFNKVILTDFA